MASSTLAAEAESGAPPRPERATGSPALDHAPRIASYSPDDFPVPTGREEEWRFTPLERLHGLHDGTAGPSGSLRVGVAAAPEVGVDLVGRDDPRLAGGPAPTDRVAAAAWAEYEQAVVVTVPAGTRASAETTVTLTGEGGVAFGHVLIEAGAGSEAVVVLDHVGTGVYAGAVEVRVGDGARLTLVSLQDWEPGSVHVGHQQARIGRDATLRSVVVTLGGDVVRLSPTVDYAGPGGQAELLGVFYADAGQHLEHRIFVDHAVPHCRSDVVYKGALQGQDAHTVWIGDVLVRREAVGSDTYEINRNLLLTQGTRADSVPNLELETGEVVGAGHASATGRFDDEQLFYLRSRGIPADVARRLVVHGFFADVIARIGVVGLEARLLAAVEAELAAADAAGGPA